MKRKLHYTFILLVTFFPLITFAQAPTLGATSDFAIFTAIGPVSNTGFSYITGDVGSNNGSNTAFGNVNGNMHSADAATAAASTDLITLYGQLNSAIPTLFPSSLLGGGLTFTPGIYSIASAATLNGTLYLDAQGNSNALFIIQIGGPLSTAAGAKVKLVNGALACNVFWKVEGLVSMGAQTYMCGTIVANNAAIEMNSLDTLQGRAFSTSGAITISGVLIDKPIGCGSVTLTGPAAPALGKAECYSIFSSDGAVTNVGTSNIVGNVGSNNGAVSGFDPLLIAGELHLIADVSTAAAAADLLLAYTTVNTLATDITLLFPAQFGNGLVLTPHTYLLDAATTFTDSLYLDAQGNADAVFVIKINGALTTSTYAKVLLINGAKAENVYWKIEGAVNINDYSEFKGTIICNNGATSAFTTGVNIVGRMLITNGAIATTAVNIGPAVVSPSCVASGIFETPASKNMFVLSPNPFSTYLKIDALNAIDINNSTIVLYNSLGQIVSSTIINQASMLMDTYEYTKGLYFYQIVKNSNAVQTGKLIVQ